MFLEGFTIQTEFRFFKQILTVTLDANPKWSNCLILSLEYSKLPDNQIVVIWSVGWLGVPAILGGLAVRTELSVTSRWKKGSVNGETCWIGICFFIIRRKQIEIWRKRVIDCYVGDWAGHKMLTRISMVYPMSVRADKSNGLQIVLKNLQGQLEVLKLLFI